MRKLEKEIELNGFSLPIYIDGDDKYISVLLRTFDKYLEYIESRPD